MSQQDGRASIVEIFNFFSDNKANDYKLARFRSEWAELSDKDKDDLACGIGNGSLTY